MAGGDLVSAREVAVVRSLDGNQLHEVQQSSVQRQNLLITQHTALRV